ncbi:MAG: molybdate ABC transporter substrate-binding protein [Chthoniobacterales bacterium]
MRLVLFFLLIGVASLSAEPVLVAAASDLQFVLPELIAQYQTTHPDVKIGPTYGASGKFYEQLKNGAPFDLFLSADAAFPRKLIADGLASESDFFLYGTGHLVLWVPKNSPLDLPKQGIRALLDPSVKKIAIANPDHAPYGRAAVAALRSLGVYDAVKDRLVLGENVVQAAQFVQTGAAEAGLIGLSLALAPKLQAEGRYWEIPSDAYPRLEQAGILLRNAPNAPDAREFKLWLQTPEAQIVWKKAGFTLPAE